MRIGGLAWFIAGFAFCLMWLKGGLGMLFGVLVSVVSGLVTFLGALGTGVLLAVTAAAGLLIGREWSERTRGKKDADDAWNRRSAHRR